MPYYDQQQPGTRDRITQALLAIQNPPPVTPQLEATPGPGLNPPVAGMQGMTQATTVTPGVASPLGSGTVAAMTTPQMPGMSLPGMTSTLGQQQQAAAPTPAASPMPQPRY